MKVTFTYCTEDVVINEHQASIEIPDGVENIEEFIEQNLDLWNYEGWEGVSKCKCTGAPEGIEVESVE